MRFATFLLLSFGVTGAWAGSGPGQEEHADPVRGKYIVEQLVMCARCHSPKNDHDEVIESRNLQGAPIEYLSPFPEVRYANTAPSIAGLPQYTIQEAITLFTTGISRTGKELRGPMPQFRMNHQDALDVATYLKSMP